MALFRRSRGRKGAGDWLRCPACAEILPAADVVRQHRVCPACDHHYPLTIAERVALLLDEASFEELDRELHTEDLLRFRGGRRYKEELQTARKQTPSDEAVRSGIALLLGRRVAVCLVDPGFLHGSLGSVASERLCRTFGRASEQRIPAVLVACGQGLRFQEGGLGMSQLARVAEHRARLYGAGIPFFSVLVSPLPDGAARSVAYAGDVIVAEPGPADAQPGRSAEDLLSLGLVDRIVRRPELKSELSRLIQLLSPA